MEEIIIVSEQPPIYCTLKFCLYNEIFSILRKNNVSRPYTWSHSSFDFPVQHIICDRLCRNIIGVEGISQEGVREVVRGS